MIPEEKKSKHRLTQEDCETVRLLLARRRTLKEIAEIIGVDPSTVGKIRLAGYDLNTYLEQRRAMNRKTKENKRAAEATKSRIVPLDKLIGTVADEERDKKILDQLEEEREAEKNGMTVEMYRFCKKLREKQETQAEVPGQMKMDLDQQADNPEEDMRNYMLMKYDDSKQKKFQAAMMDKLLNKLDELINVLKGGTGNG